DFDRSELPFPGSAGGRSFGASRVGTYCRDQADPERAERIGTVSMKVFITGMGACSSLGNGVNTLFTSLLEGRSNIRHYPDWQKYNGLGTHLAAPVPEYDIS